MDHLLNALASRKRVEHSILVLFGLLLHINNTM